MVSHSHDFQSVATKRRHGRSSSVQGAERHEKLCQPDRQVQAEDHGEGHAHMCCQGGSFFCYRTLKLEVKVV